MSLEEMAEKYSKKWGVPLDEAEKKVKEFLTKKPERKFAETGGDRSKLAPGTENLFPDPIGPISKKLLDINQAVLSTAYTQRTLKDLSQPPEELKTLREKMDFFEKNLEGMMTLMNTTMKDMQSTLQVQKAEKEKEALLEEVAGVINPLKEKIEELEKWKGGNGGPPPELTPEKILETANKMTEDASSFLKSRGYNVEVPKALTLEEVEGMLKEKMTKKEQEWEEKKGSQVEIEKERIKATEEILTGVVDRIFTIFLEPLKDKIHEAIEKGAFGPRKPAA